MLYIELEYAFTNTLAEIHSTVMMQKDIFSHELTPLEKKRLDEVCERGLGYVISCHNGEPKDILNPYGVEDLDKAISGYGEAAMIGQLNYRMSSLLSVPEGFTPQFQNIILFSMMQPSVQAWQRAVKVIDSWNNQALRINLPYLLGCSFNPSWENIPPKLVICGKAGTYDKLSKTFFFNRIQHQGKLRLLQASWNHRHPSVKLTEADLFFKKP